MSPARPQPCHCVASPFPPSLFSGEVKKSCSEAGGARAQSRAVTASCQQGLRPCLALPAGAPQWGCTAGRHLHTCSLWLLLLPSSRLYELP